MGYCAEVSRDNPGCIVFLVDQSSSMSRPFGVQPDKRKSEGVCDAINKLLLTLSVRCARAEGLRDYFQIGVIGYGREVRSILNGSSPETGLVSIKSISENPLRVESRVKQIPDGAGGLVEQSVRFPVWFEPVADGSTKMKEAFALARKWIASFLSKYPDCFPPLVINLTDGAADADQDPAEEAQAVRSLQSSDGHTLLFNGHISSRPDEPIVFPEDPARLPDDFARRLFDMSSVLPVSFVDIAAADGFPVTAASRGFAFNADLVAVIKLIDIGTRAQQRQMS